MFYKLIFELSFPFASLHLKNQSIVNCMKSICNGFYVRIRSWVIRIQKLSKAFKGFVWDCIVVMKNLRKEGAS